ncbi:L-histidine N(alpha)-methyltransferase [Frankia sp. AgB1.9]|uniref:L-histidine N(alpha)-methyltransferase n=1 Tax=unclassified Frankia TaxID=2632575 RepID=UPI001932F4C6|nr:MULTISPECIES: L-histidine N(alpha)-methyltransferase [unclassified Frankia]MBL7490676.1 L-histidine N(alpha)-methyltransferase [Frankia sp. AgW1.1]MBL7547490.1 L-histidine N(alpha)-methyltransferase [Frankia sp. AgB1.9]MBL7619001.1 L-histidine N(alpha)-methyltransferase [Frankia sp. AgB1.8]
MTSRTPTSGADTVQSPDAVIAGQERAVHTPDQERTAQTPGQNRAAHTPGQARAARTPTPADVAALLKARGGMTIERHLTDAQRTAALAADVRRGLTATPKELPPTWFYDTTGSMLFGKITELPEYYQTRAERAILATHAAQLAAELETAVPGGVDSLVELGSGTSEKTRTLLAALAGTGRLRRFIPFDVDAEALSRAGAAARATHPGLAVHAVVGDFRQHLGLLPAQPAGGTLVAFLGGTIGNLRPPERAALLTELRSGLDQANGSREHGGRAQALLLGTDLVKEPARLVAAYDDSAGVTAAFNRNLLTVLNRELGADFDLRGFAHVAQWDAENRWIEMRLRSVKAQTVKVTALDLTVEFAEGEEIRTEISAKFDHAMVERELAAAGWRLAQWWTDPDGDYALSLAIAT